MKVLVIGANGQLGSVLLNSLKKNFEVIGTYIVDEPEDMIKLDITNNNEVNRVMDKIKPNIVINTAALTHVDRCEDETELAYSINVQGNTNLFNKCKEINCKLIFVSSYYVFDGEKGWYSETDKIKPLNVYAKTKIESEKITLQESNNLVIRTSKIYSWGIDNRNFIARMINTLKQGNNFETTNDQFNNPISANDLAFSIKRLIQENATGIYNTGGPDYVNNFDFAKITAEVFNLNKKLIIGKSTQEFNAKALRPKKCALKIDKLINKINFSPKSIKENLKEWKNN